MSEELLKPPVNRREFMKAAALAAVVAASAGATAAVLVDRNKGSTPLPSLIQDFELPAVTGGQPSADFINQLTSVQVENARLRTQLNAALGELEVAKMRKNGLEAESTNALHAQLEESSNQNIALASEVTVLGGLVALYEQLEAIDLESIVEDGISTVEGTFSDLLLQMPKVEDGLAISQEALIDLESQIPALESGRLWLVEQFDTLDVHLDDLETTLSTAVKSAGPILGQLADWFQDISKWLPFGIGEKAANTMASLNQVLGDLLETREEMPAQLADPLAALLERDEEETAVQTNLINPIREELINPTAQAMEKAGSLRSVFKTDLVSPFTGAAEERKSLAEIIAEYRQIQQI